MTLENQTLNLTLVRIKKMKFLPIILLILFSLNCYSQKSGIRTIHVFVALCDNENQGIVPVPAAIGNGQDPANNLYWGCGYGLKTYFAKKSDNWKLLRTDKYPFSDVIERAVFKDKNSETYLVADAYDGAEIEQTIINFLHASSGQFKDTLLIDDKKIPIGGNSDLIAYVGHNGLMDFDIEEKFKVNRTKTRDIIILACYSRNYFHTYMEKFNTNPLVWSKGLMSAEAYTLAWAIEGWLKNESNNQIVDRARQAYNHYQKCGIKGATNLLQTGFIKE